MSDATDAAKTALDALCQRLCEELETLDQTPLNPNRPWRVELNPEEAVRIIRAIHGLQAAEEPCLDDDDQPIICAKCKAPILVGESGYITRRDGIYHMHACYGLVLAAELNHARSALRSVLDVPVSDEPGALVAGIATLVEQRDSFERTAHEAAIAMYKGGT